MAQLFAVKISSFPIERLPGLLSLLPHEKAERLRKFIRREDLIRGLLGDLLVRRLASDKLKYPPEALRFGTNSYGKPYVSYPEKASAFHYNLSHSGEWVVCAIDDEPVGVDIEKIDSADIAIADRFFSPEEVGCLRMERDELSRQLLFYGIWTAKESYVKAIGSGLSKPLDSFSVVFSERLGGTGIIDGEQWHLRQYPLDPGYVLTSCAKSRMSAEAVDIVDLERLLDSFDLPIVRAEG
ncbi:4'-phosphopantetheinyl transferase family protein [Cohnella faecalis]|uniref:4'-phosphopantetheinyl transferase n=1 Tax=Cohnella faecalis TaxID=2315694 RepID=A0A398CNS7_9BACL|nr:4'-phosphopantetheinyl transferase superfamily protein [Cohnella faecalis]RIE02378.1 4'-phosphopantetheinyl transferase [Cohnella faecalis]